MSKLYTIKQQRKRAKATLSETRTIHPPMMSAAADDTDDRDDDNESTVLVESTSPPAIEPQPNPIASDNNNGDNQLIRDITSTGRHFSKVANMFKFENNTQGYVDWTVQFSAEMSNYDLADTLTEDPNGKTTEPTALEKHRQKTVYHMILYCIPNAQVRQVVTTALPPSLHSGYGAWRALRAHFIGDELAYLQSIESKFVNFRWENSESWSTFEARYESLLAELSAVKVEKDEHVCKGRLMAAIQESNRKDAQQSSVFARLHTTNRIKENLPYRQWLIAIRTEAQMIQDELVKRGASGKRARDEGEEGEFNSQEVSFVAPNGSFNMGQRTVNLDGLGQHTKPGFRRPNGPPNGPGAAGGCFNWARNRHCRFGNQCKFGHDLSGQRGGGGGGGHAGGGGGGATGGGGFHGFNRGGDRPPSSNRGDCYEFIVTKRCRRGAACGFQHTSNGGGSYTNQTDKDTKHQAL